MKIEQLSAIWALPAFDPIPIDRPSVDNIYLLANPDTGLPIWEVSYRGPLGIKAVVVHEGIQFPVDPAHLYERTDRESVQRMLDKARKGETR